MLADGKYTYLYGPSTGSGQASRLAQYQTEMQYFGADGLGSVRQLYDATGQVLANNRYDPYGNVMSQYGEAASVFGYTGEQRDAATGLEYLRARYYSSAQGRFFQQDSWPGDDLRPQSLNAYSYVGNNVVTYADPSGRCYGQLEGIRRVAVEGDLCGYLDMAIYIVNSPTATEEDKRWANLYIGGWSGSHGLLLIGAGVTGVGLVQGVEAWGGSYLLAHSAAAVKVGEAAAGLSLLADTGLMVKALSGDQDAQIALVTAYQASGYMPFQGLPAVWNYLSWMKFLQFGIPCADSTVVRALTGRLPQRAGIDFQLGGDVDLMTPEQIRMLEDVLGKYRVDLRKIGVAYAGEMPSDAYSMTLPQGFALGPNAFRSEEVLMSSIFHEVKHLADMNALGSEFSSAMVPMLERLAEEAEQGWRRLH